MRKILDILKKRKGGVVVYDGIESHLENLEIDPTFGIVVARIEHPLGSGRFRKVNAYELLTEKERDGVE